MAYSKKGIYHFRSPSEVGVDSMPLKRTAFVESTNSLYVKDSDAGLTSSSTVQDAINNNNLLAIANGGGGGGGQSYLYQYQFKATAGQTVFYCTYNPDFVYISVAGVDLADSQYTADNGNSITLSEAAAEDEVVRIYSISDVNATSMPGLDDLTDVEITQAADKQILQFDSASGKWINVAPEFGNLKSDGSIPMDAGYTPTNDQDIATKVSVQEEVITRLEANVHFNLNIFGV